MEKIRKFVNHTAYMGKITKISQSFTGKIVKLASRSPEKNCEILQSVQGGEKS